MYLSGNHCARFSNLDRVIETFDSDDFTDYSEWFESYIIANNIGLVAETTNDTTKRAANKKKETATIFVLITKSYSTLKGIWFSPLKKLKNKLKNYYY